MVYGINQSTEARVCGVIPNRERLRYVTENFEALQGLKWVALGMFWLAAPIQDAYPDWRPIQSWAFWLVFLATLIAVARFIPKYYEQRFGSVERKTPSNRQVVIGLALFVTLLMFGKPIGKYADNLLGTARDAFFRPASDSDHHSYAHLAPLWFAWIWASLVVTSSKPYRSKMYFVASGLIFWAAIAFYPLQHPAVLHFMFWRVVNANGSLGISLIVCGLYDHFTLISLFPRKASGKQ